jgi:hypothetical protein
MKNFTFSQSIRFFVILMISLGLLSAGIQDMKCSTGEYSHVSKVEMKNKIVRSVRPLFEKIFLI